MKVSIKQPKTASSNDLTWFYNGSMYRVTPWPELRFERQTDAGWASACPEEDAFFSTPLALDESAWRRFLDFFPNVERTFLMQFRFGRMAALQLLARCPALLSALCETPALTSFLTFHASLRGVPGPRWEEIAAVFERNGVFGILEWIGLPASRQTLAILAHVADPDVPKRLLEPLRTILWVPEVIFALQRKPTISDRELSYYCHALAA